MTVDGADLIWDWLPQIEWKLLHLGLATLNAAGGEEFTKKEMPYQW